MLRLTILPSPINVIFLIQKKHSLEDIRLQRLVAAPQAVLHQCDLGPKVIEGQGLLDQVDVGGEHLY